MSPSETLSSSTDFPDVQLYGFPAPPISRRDEEGFSSCLARPCHRTAPNTPPKCLAASVSCDDPCCLRPVSGGSAFGANFSRPPVGSLALRPGDLLTILKMALSIGFRSSVSFLSAIQATGLLTPAPVGLSPTEHASLCWTRRNEIPSADHSGRDRFPLRRLAGLLARRMDPRSTV